jgi:hypothetical protein
MVRTNSGCAPRWFAVDHIRAAVGMCGTGDGFVGALLARTGFSVLADAQTRTSCRDRRVRQERRFEDGPHGSRPRGIGRGSRTSLRECPSVEERRFEDARTSRICGISGRANSDIASQRSGCARTGTYRKPGRRPWRAVSDARIRTLRSGRRGAPGPARQVTRWAASGREILGRVF